MENVRYSVFGSAFILIIRTVKPTSKIIQAAVIKIVGIK